MPWRGEKKRKRERGRDGNLVWKVEEQFSRGHCEFQSSSDWQVPRADDLFSTEDFVLPDFQSLKKNLNESKSRLNDVEINAWHAHTRRAHVGGIVVQTARHECNAELCTQAWVKFHELLVYHDLVPVDGDSCFSVHLCEAPGAFVTSLNHYIQTQTLSTKWQWLASTLNPYCSKNAADAMLDDDRFIRFTRDHWYFCKDDTGDLMSKSNIRSLWTRVATMVDSSLPQDCTDPLTPPLGASADSPTKDTRAPCLAVTDSRNGCPQEPSKEASGLSELQSGSAGGSVLGNTEISSKSSPDMNAQENDITNQSKTKTGFDSIAEHRSRNSTTSGDGVTLVTADGSVDCQDVPEEQERHVASLHFCEVVAALGLLAHGGSLVLKMFTLFESSSICLIYLLNCVFDQVSALR